MSLLALVNESFILYSTSNLSDNVSPTTLELGDYFEDQNAANGLMYSNIEFDSKYFEMSKYRRELISKSNVSVQSRHLNICSLPSIFEQVNLFLAQLAEKSITLDFILLCETFVNEHNYHVYNIPGYYLEHMGRKNSSSCNLHSGWSEI